MVRSFPHIGAEMLAGPMPFDCEHIVDSGLGRLISMENWPFAGFSWVYRVEPARSGGIRPFHKSAGISS